MGLGGEEAASKLRGRGAQFALLCFIAIISPHRSPPTILPSYHYYCLKKKKKALLILESCLSEMLKIKTVCTSKDKYHLS